MEALSLSALSKPLVAIGKALAPVVKQLRAERQAGADSASVKTALLDAPLEDTLNRLQNITAHESWWRDLLQRAESAYVRPGYLEKPSIREWLSEPSVRDDLKTLARMRLVPGDDGEDAISGRLSGWYAAHTGEAAAFAAGPIDAVVNILLAGTLARGAPGDLLVVGVIQESHAKTAAQLDRIEDKIGSLSGDDLVVQAHTEKARAALDHILRRRSLPLVDARAELAMLAASLDGDLRFCAKPMKGQIYLWAGRLYAQDKEQLDSARRYRANALTVVAAPDTTVVDAWLAVHSGDVPGGLALLRDIDAPDARSNVFLILARQQGAAAAIEWLEAHKPVDLGFFTALGWKNAATTLAETGRWEDAAAYLEALPAAMAVECPDLPFVDGVIHAGLTLPAWVRRFALTMQVVERQIERLEGAEAAAHHRRALASFEAAKRTLTDISEKGRAGGAETWRVWLLLSEPSSRQEGKQIVAAAMRDGAKAVDYAQLAHTFNIPFDPAPLERYLRVRELAGGLTPPEVAAKLALWRQTRTKAEVVGFLEEERATLTSAITPGGYCFLLVTALAEADQLDRAEEALRGNREAFGDDFDRLQDQIRLRRGEDVSKSFEDRFLETDADIDLQVLCDALLSGQDIDKLHRYSLELFRRQRNRRNARRVSEALARGERHQEIVEFLDAADDLLQIDDDLAALKAWSLFYGGRIVDAQLINDRLREQRDNPNDRILEINVALAACTWEKFSDILNREWAARDKREPRYLLQLARLAADTDKDRVVQLMREAAAKAATDPDLLASAAVLAYRLGQDEEAMPWVAEAARLSSLDGPVQTRGMRELLDIAMAGADRARGVQEAFSAASIPIHVAASFWRAPLVRLLVGQPRDNERERDPRRRTIVPIRHGARGLMDLSPARTVVIDITSLLLLSELELLGALEKRFDRVTVPWSATEWLLTETNSCRFHQPSRVAGAKKLRELIVDNTLRVFAPTAEPPASLVKEVGRELAELLYAAKEANGRVVRPLPIHRLQSLMEEEADLADYTAVIMSTVQFLDMLQADAVVDHRTAERARGMLTAAEHREPRTSGEPGTGPFFLDGLAIAYLSGAGLLDSLHRSARDLQVHPATVQELEDLIRTEGETARALEVLSRLRVWLRDQIATRHVEVLPRARLSEEDVGIETRLVQELLADLGTADAVLIDDRMVGGLWRATDRAGRTVPVIDTLDLLHDFTLCGLLSVEQRWQIHHALRSRGFVCIPLELEELESYLGGAEPDATTGLLRERAELRAIRENLQRLRSTAILQQPAETPYLDRLRIASLVAIRKLWTDAAVPAATATARTDWIWRTLMSSPIDWAHTIVNPDGVVAPMNGFLNEIAALLMIPIPDLERGRAFRDWFGNAVLAPLEVVSPGVLDDLTAMIRARIRGWIDEWTAGPQSG